MRDGKDLQAGDVEVLVAGTGSNDDSYEVGAGAVALGGNVYINDYGTAITVRQALSFTDTGPGSDTWNGASRLGVQQTFDIEGPVKPFIGALLGRLYGDTVDDTWTGGAEAGIKWYAQENAFLNASIEYQFLFDSNDQVGDVGDDGTFFYVLGFGVRF